MTASSTNTYTATAANLRRARGEFQGEPFCRCCGVGAIALREAEAAVLRVREIDALAAEDDAVPDGEQ